MKHTFFEEHLKHPDPEMWLSQSGMEHVCPRNASGREHLKKHFKDFKLSILESKGNWRSSSSLLSILHMKKLRLRETIGSEVLHLVAKLDLEANAPQSQSDLVQLLF